MPNERKEIKMNNDPEWVKRQARAEEELYAQGWNGCVSVGGPSLQEMIDYFSKQENTSRFVKKLTSDLKKIEDFSAKPIPRMGDMNWVKPMTNWRNADANITKPSDFVKKYEQEIPTYSPEAHAVLGQMMNDTIQKMREEQAYKIWLYENKPNGEQEELCPFCVKLFKIKDRHYWEAMFELLYKNEPDWRKNEPVAKMVCDSFHKGVKMTDEVMEAVRNRRQEEYIKRAFLMPDPIEDFGKIEQLDITDDDDYWGPQTEEYYPYDPGDPDGDDECQTPYKPEDDLHAKNYTQTYVKNIHTEEDGDKSSTIDCYVCGKCGKYKHDSHYECYDGYGTTIATYCVDCWEEMTCTLYNETFCPNCYRMFSDDVYMVSDRVDHYGCNKCMSNI